MQWTQRSLKNTKEQNYVPRYNGYMNSGREMVWVNPHARDQSNKEPLYKANNWVPVVFGSSNIWRFCSLQIVHIKHSGTKFQMFDEC